MPFDNFLTTFQQHLNPYLPRILLYKMEVLKDFFLELNFTGCQIQTNTEFSLLIL